MVVTSGRDVEWIDEPSGEVGRRVVKCRACGEPMEVERYIPRPDRVMWGCPWCCSWVSLLVETGEVWGSAFRR